MDGCQPASRRLPAGLPPGHGSTVERRSSCRFLVGGTSHADPATGGSRKQARYQPSHTMALESIGHVPDQGAARSEHGRLDRRRGRRLDPSSATGYAPTNHHRNRSQQGASWPREHDRQRPIVLYEFPIWGSRPETGSGLLIELDPLRGFPDISPMILDSLPLRRFSVPAHLFGLPILLVGLLHC